MKLGVMQPYFFPYLGHFALIDAVDKWIVFDVSQYTPKSWMNRNRILHPKSGFSYVTVPLERSSINLKTCHVYIKDIDKVKTSILGKLSHYRKQAPYYWSVLEIVQRAFENAKTNKLVDLNVSALSETCQYLGIVFNYEICSELGLAFPQNMGPGDWAPFISDQLNASAYVNPNNGIKLFDIKNFEDKNITLHAFYFSTFSYDTGTFNFEANLSILDVMMWNDPSLIKKAIQEKSFEYTV